MSGEADNAGAAGGDDPLGAPGMAPVSADPFAAGPLGADPFGAPPMDPFGAPPMDPFGAPPMDQPAFPGDEKKDEKPVDGIPVSRLQVLEYLDGRNWWRFGQVALSFTFVLWVNFIVIMFLRADVSVSYDLNEALVLHVQQIVAHPSLSGVALRNTSEIPMLCRCSCRSSLAPVPKSACDSTDSEVLDFLGSLPAGKERLVGLDTEAFAAAGLSAAAHLVNPADDSASVEVMTWDDILSVQDVMFWIEHGFVPDVWTHRSVKSGDSLLPGLLARKNLVIGGIRARQKRAKPSNDCEKKVSTSLLNFYLPTCRSTEPAAEVYGSGVDGFVPSDTEHGFFDVFLDTERPLNETQPTVAYHREHGWLDGISKSLHLQAVLLNADVGMFIILEVTFEFPFGGGVEKKVKVNTIHCGREMQPQDYIPEIIWALLIVLLLRQEIAQWGWECYERRCLQYWKDMWCYLDWGSIIVGGLIAVFWFHMAGQAKTISDNVIALPRAPFASGFNVEQYRETWGLILDDVMSLFKLKQYYQLSLFWYTLILMLRCLKGYLGQAKLAMLQTTIGHTFWDVLHLMLFFIVVFVNFTIGGHILFGAELWNWSTLVKSSGASLRMMMGAFEFEEMYEVAPFSSTVWFWCFLLFVVFIFMNFLFAIIADYFGTYREAVGVTSTIFDDMFAGFKDLVWRVHWRRQQWDDGEYKACCCSDPYYEIVEELMGMSEVTESFERNARISCLGVKLGRKKMESLSVEGLAAEGHPGAKITDLTDLQNAGAEVMCADHLLEEGQEFVRKENALRKQSQVVQVRGFIKMLRQYRQELESHCDAIETGIFEDCNHLLDAVDRLEESSRICLQEFEERKQVGVFSMAPPMDSLPRPGTIAAREAQMQSLAGQGGLLKAVNNLQNQKAKIAKMNQRNLLPIGMSAAGAAGAAGQALMAIAPDPFQDSSQGALPVLRDAANELGHSPPQALMDVTMQPLPDFPTNEMGLAALPAPEGPLHGNTEAPDGPLYGDMEGTGADAMMEVTDGGPSPEM